MSATGAPVTKRTENIVKENRAFHADFRVQVLRRAAHLPSRRAAHVRWRKCRPCSRAHVGTHRVRRAALLWGCTSRRRVPVQGDLRRRRSRRVLHAVRRRASAAAGRPRAALGG